MSGEQFMNFRTLLFAMELIIAELMYAGELQKKKHFTFRFILSQTVLVAAMYMINKISQQIISMTDNASILSSIFTYFSIFLLTIAAFRVSFESKLHNILFCCVAGYCSQHTVTTIYGIIVTLMGTDYMLLRFGSQNFTSLLIYLGVSVPAYIGVYFFAKKMTCSFDMDEYKGVEIFFLLTIFINIFVGTIGERRSEQNLSLNITTLLGQIFTNVLILDVQFVGLRRVQLRKEKAVVEQLLRDREEQFKFSKDQAELLSIKAHDLKHQVSILRKGGEPAEKLLNELDQVVNMYDKIIKTNNPTLNVILNEKWLYCERHQIKLSCTVPPNCFEFMEQTDLYALLGNLLDNAIEAVMKIKDTDKRIISISIGSMANYSFIQTNNYFLGVIEEDGEFQTTKTYEEGYHGYGIKSIRYIVNKYGGDIQMLSRDNMFIVQVTVPISSPHTS